MSKCRLVDTTALALRDNGGQRVKLGSLALYQRQIELDFPFVDNISVNGHGERPFLISMALIYTNHFHESFVGSLPGAYCEYEFVSERAACFRESRLKSVGGHVSFLHLSYTASTLHILSLINECWLLFRTRPGTVSWDF